MTPTISDAQLARNRRLQKYYPLGLVDGIWDNLERLRSYCSEAERKKLSAVFQALDAADTEIRKRYR